MTSDEETTKRNNASWGSLAFSALLGKAQLSTNPKLSILHKLDDQAHLIAFHNFALRRRMRKFPQVLWNRFALTVGRIPGALEGLLLATSWS